MRLRGEATLVFRDINTGEITKEITESNYVTEDMLNRMANCAYDVNDYGGGAQGRFGQNIHIGGLRQEHDRGWNQMWDVLDRGVTESGVTSPQLLSGNVGTGASFAYYYQYQQRFAPPAADRTIHMIGINRDDYTTYTTTASEYARRPLYVSAYLVLTTPCTQTTTETLDIFYRIVWDNPEQDTSTYVPSQQMMYYIAQRHLYGSTQYTYYPYNSAFCYHGRKYVPNVRNQWLHMGQRGYGDLSTSQNGGDDALTGKAYLDSGYRARMMYLQGDLTECLGMIIGSVYHTGMRNIGDPQHISMFMNPAVPATVSPIQNTFSHGAAATGPFYSATTIPTGTGTLNINGDGWTNPDWQKFLRIEMTQSGTLAGSPKAEYKLMMRNTTGFINNTYDDNVVAIPFINNYNNYHGVMLENGASDNGSGRIWALRSWTEKSGAQCMDYDGVSTLLGWTHYMVFKYNTITNERQAWRSDTTPASNFTDLSQVCIADNGDIWVADAQTGLHRIHADGLTIDSFDNTHPSLTGIANNECFGVTKTPGRIWAIMNDSLIYTTDNGATFGIYNSGSSPAFAIAPVGQERRYWFLQGDPNHADHRLAVGYNNYTTFGNIGQYYDLRITWWDSISGAGGTTPVLTSGSSNSDIRFPEPQRRRELFQFFTCSPNDGVWGARRSRDVSGPDDDAPAMWSFGATTPTHTYTPGTSDDPDHAIFWWTKDVSGNDAMLFVRNNSNVPTFALGLQGGTQHDAKPINMSNSGGYPTGLPALGSSAMISGGLAKGLHKAFFKDAGIICFNGRNPETASDTYNWFIVSVADANASDSGAFKKITWKEYGWNGSAWELDNPNGKPVHDTHEALIDGLTVRFGSGSPATGTYIATDYYTVGVIDGIMMDGGTQFDTRYALYYKPVDFNRTEVEGGGVLPASTSTAFRSLNESEVSTIIDGQLVAYDAGNDRFYGTSNGFYNWGAKMYGATSGKILFQSRCIDLPNTAGVIMVIGLCTSAKVGAFSNINNIDYGVRISSVTNDNWKMEVVSNGTVVHTEYDPSPTLGSIGGDFNNQNDDHSYIRFFRDTGSTDVEVRLRNKIIHTFTGVSGALIPAFAANYEAGPPYFYWSSHQIEFTDYFVDLGDSGTNVGKFDPNFWAIDGTISGRPANSEIKINGVPVTARYINNYTTPLAAGEVDLLTYQGKIRYSAADIGKTLTIDRYNVILHE